MRVHLLQRIFLSLRRSIFVAVGYLHVGGNGRHAAPSHGREGIGQRLTVNFQLARSRFGIFHKVLESDVAVVVPGRAFHLINAQLLHFLVGQLAFLGLALHAQGVDVFLGDAYGRHVGLAVLVTHLHGGKLVEVLLLYVEGIHLGSGNTQLLGQFASNILIGLRLEQRVDNLLVGHHHFAIRLMAQRSAE